VLSYEQRKLQEVKRENATSRGLHAAANHTSVPSQPKEKNNLLLVLPADGKVEAALAKHSEDPNEIILNGSLAILYTIHESQNFVLSPTSAGTRYHAATSHIPKYRLLTLNTPKHTCPKSSLRLEPHPQEWLNGVLRQHWSLFILPLGD